MPYDELQRLKDARAQIDWALTAPACHCELCQWARAYHGTLAKLLDAEIQCYNPHYNIDHPGCGEY